MRISDWSSDVCSSDLISKQLPDVLKAAHAHKGTSFVEIFQNCIVYNKDVFADFTEKKNADLGQLWLEHGKPMLFAKGTKGLRLNLDHLQDRKSTRMNSSQSCDPRMPYSACKKQTHNTQTITKLAH